MADLAGELTDGAVLRSRLGVLGVPTAGWRAAGGRA